LPDTRALSSILSLARSGATQRAWDAFVAAGFDRRDDNAAALTLYGRLLKDREEFAKSSEIYASAASLTGQSYPLINAATMALLAGDNSRAELLGRAVLDLISAGKDQGETPYWLEATRAEAHLLLAETDAARSSITTAVSLAPAAHEDIAATLRQFKRICRNREQDCRWLDSFAPPIILCFSGIMGIPANEVAVAQKISAQVNQIAPGYGYGALAAGADILIAEALIDAAAEVHAILPCPVDEFASRSVTAFGSEWTPRFYKLLDQVSSLTITNQNSPISIANVTIAAETALGLAQVKAELLETSIAFLRVSGAGTESINLPTEISDLKVFRIDSDIPREIADFQELSPGLTNYWLATAMPIQSAVITSVQFEDIHDCRIWQCQNLQSAMEIAALVSQSNRVNNVAIDVWDSSDERVNSAQIKRLCRMAQLETVFDMIGSENAAMATRTVSPSPKLQPLGELATNEGELALYAIIPSVA
jgi:hypothetical protein